jgi:cephalosporin hydroxylase
MRLEIDTEARTLVHDGRSFDLYSPEGFDVLSRCWERVGWTQKYSYAFSWLGRPVIQLPEDLLRVQDVLFQTQPDVIVETGVAHGGSLIFYASICHALGKGRVIGIDVEIRPHNRSAIEQHALSRYITLIDGSSIDPVVVNQVQHTIEPTESTMIILDSDHSYAHVSKELEAYSRLVAPGGYVLVQDGVMHDLAFVPGAGEGWLTDNPAQAARDFVARHPEFVFDAPHPSFSESSVREYPTYWKNGWLKRIR